MLLTPASGKALSRGMLDVLIRAGLIAILAIACYWVFHPFLNLMLWSVILAVTLYPLQRKLRARLGKDGRAATVIVLLVIAALAVPCWVIGNSLIESASSGLKMAHDKEMQVPAPRAEVAKWPIVGPRVFQEWQYAYDHPAEMKAKLGPKLKGAVVKGLGMLGDVAAGLLLAPSLSTVSTVTIPSARRSAVSSESARREPRFSRTISRSTTTSIVCLRFLSSSISSPSSRTTPLTRTRE